MMTTLTTATTRSIERSGLAVWLLTTMLALAGISCSTIHRDTGSESFRRKLGHASYAEVKAVKQSTRQSCGAACLACVLDYWEKPVTEPALVAKYKCQGKIGYPLQQLRVMALQEGLLAFAVAMDKGSGTPAAQLTEQIQRGRPVICALYCPTGRYFGAPLPVIESLDRRTFRPFNLGEAWKHHYVVVFGEDTDDYLIMDPAYGLVPVRKNQLLSFWGTEKHAALVCAPRPVAAGTASATAP